MESLNATYLRVGRARLLRLADLLDVVDAQHKEKGEGTYYQGAFEHTQIKVVGNDELFCYTPACGLGHYAAAFGDESEQFRWSPTYGLVVRDDHRTIYGEDDSAASLEFGITGQDGYNLFSGFGCSSASSGQEAAAYIRNFVRVKDALVEDEGVE